jgi:hypothetical protein
MKASTRSKPLKTKALDRETSNGGVGGDVMFVAAAVVAFFILPWEKPQDVPSLPPIEPLQACSYLPGDWPEHYNCIR